MSPTRRRAYRSRLSALICGASGAGPGRGRSDFNRDRLKGDAAMKIVERTFAEVDRRALLAAGIHPLLARLYAARRIHSADELEYGAAQLLAPTLMKSIGSAAQLLAEAIAARKRLLIMAAYDADGATACAVGIRALRAFGADVDYLVPDRFRLGYGLTPERVDLAASSAKGGSPELSHAGAHGRAGLPACLAAAGRQGPEASSWHLGCVIGQGLNPAGGLADMSVGIECLSTDDEARAANPAQGLDRLNRERRKIESAMLEQALLFIRDIPDENARSSFFDPDWHQGVVGILASRLKDRLHRPVICFAKGTEAASEGTRAVLKGSGRSIAGLHLRDCLDLVAKRAPGLILRFGGHAQAAGLTIGAGDYERFAAAFESAIEEMLPPEARMRTIE